MFTARGVSGMFVVVLIAWAAEEQGKVLAPGDPPLTEVIVRRLAATMTYLLDAKLTGGQQERFQRGIIEYWKRNDRAAILQVIGNLKYAGQMEELAALRKIGQRALIDSLRLDTLDDVSVVLVEAYDAAHPGADRTPKGLQDLVGTWKRTDGLMGTRRPDGRMTGVSYTDSGEIAIAADGTFTHMRVHNHCSGGDGCCRLDGSTEQGMLSLNGPRLVFEIKSGRESVKDGCAPGASREGPVKPRTERVTWSLRQGVEKNSQPSLCWTTDAGESFCYARQPK